LLKGGFDVRLITDAWVTPKSIWARLPGAKGRRLRERYHEEIPSAHVTAFTLSATTRELFNRLLGISGWTEISARNDWFQRRASSVLKSLANRDGPKSGPTMVFSYSYTAHEVFRVARDLGWKTVMSQTDPGPLEEKIVAKEATRYPHLSGDWVPAPAKYWEQWRSECAFADAVIVNSDWSKEALIAEKVDESKLQVIPLAYDPPPAAKQHKRTFPTQFSRERPLRCLFLGQVNLRKGIAHLFEACDLLQGAPIEVTIVGDIQIVVPTRYREHSVIRWQGPVTRGAVTEYYKRADVFLLPTLSDGFAITQLEARAWSLPIIVSKHCGRVVIDGENGILLPSVTGAGIANAISSILQKPSILVSMGNYNARQGYSLTELSHSLSRLTDYLT